MLVEEAKRGASLGLGRRDAPSVPWELKALTEEAKTERVGEGGISSKTTVYTTDTHTRKPQDTGIIYVIQKLHV